MGNFSRGDPRTDPIPWKVTPAKPFPDPHCGAVWAEWGRSATPALYPALFSTPRFTLAKSGGERPSTQDGYCSFWGLPHKPPQTAGRCRGCTDAIPPWKRAHRAVQGATAGNVKLPAQQRRQLR